MSSLLRFILLAATVVVAFIAALPASPYFDPLFFWTTKMVGPAFAQSKTVFHGTSALIAGGTLLAAAVPAGILGRLSPAGARPIVTRLLWLAAAVAIAWPALRVVAASEV